jgi:hypothetical protein
VENHKATYHSIETQILVYCPYRCFLVGIIIYIIRTEVRITKMAGSQGCRPSARQRTKISLERLRWVYRDVLITAVRVTSPGKESKVVAAMEVLVCK